MQSFSLDSLTKIQIDPNDPNMPESVQKLTPVLFRDVNGYFCLLGTDPRSGVFGCGHTPEQAFADFDTRVQERRINNGQDELTKLIHQHMGPLPEMPFETPGAKGLS